MRLSVQCQIPVTVPPRKKWGAHYKEGLWTPCLYSCCGKHLDTPWTTGWNEFPRHFPINYAAGFILIIGVNFSVSPFLSLSLRLSSFSQVLKIDWRRFSAMLTQMLVLYQLFRLLYFRCLDIHKSNFIYWFHYMYHLFLHQFLLYLFKLLKLIWSSIRLHYKDNSLEKKCLVCDHTSLMSILEIVINFEGI